MKCQKCPEIEMELVDSHYNLELEAEYGHPVEIKTYVCPKCNCQEQETVTPQTNALPSDIDPAEPWTDPISGEVDYDEMAEDLGCPEMGEHPEDYNSEGDY